MSGVFGGNRKPHYVTSLAAVIGGIGTVIEGFIGGNTLLSGYWFGIYDTIGVVLGLFALGMVWRYPALASLLWLSTEPLLYNGRLLVSAALLPVLVLPLAAAGLAAWVWYLSRPEAKERNEGNFPRG